MRFVNIIIGRILYVLLSAIIIFCKIFNFIFIHTVAILGTIPYLIYIRWFCPCPRCEKRGEMEHTNHVDAKANFRGIELSDHWSYFLCHHCGAKLKWYRDAWKDVSEKEWDQYGTSQKGAQSVRIGQPPASDADSDKKTSKKSAKQKRKRK